MVRCSNHLLAIVNVLTFLLSVPIIWAGVWLSRQGVTECEKFLDKPVIIIGVFLMLVSLVGFIGSCFRIVWLLWIYLFVMFLSILLLICFTIMAFVVTNKGAGEVLSGKGYRQYRLGDYSHWLQNRVNNANNWKKIKSCLMDGQTCLILNQRYRNLTADQFYSKHLSPIQSGCCKPSDECGFTYAGPSHWIKGHTTSHNPDCQAWVNDEKTYCYDCQSCKAGLLDHLKGDWKKVAIVNIVFLILLIIVYSVGVCAFRNSRRMESYQKYP